MKYQRNRMFKKNLLQIATNLLPQAELVGKDVFEAMSKDIPNNLIICSKDFFCRHSQKIQEAVKDIEFSYVLVTVDGKCYIMKGGSNGN